MRDRFLERRLICSLSAWWSFCSINFVDLLIDFFVLTVVEIFRWHAHRKGWKLKTGVQVGLRKAMKNLIILVATCLVRTIGSGDSKKRWPLLRKVSLVERIHYTTPVRTASEKRKCFKWCMLARLMTVWYCVTSCSRSASISSSQKMWVKKNLKSAVHIHIHTHTSRTRVVYTALLHYNSGSYRENLCLFLQGPC